MSRIIVALDGMSWPMSSEIMWHLKDHIWGVKLNDLLIDQGLFAVRELSRYTNVMVDPKLYDIPNTITNGIVKLVDAGAKIVTVHATAEYCDETHRKYIAGVTRLTSMSADWVEKIYNTKYGEDLVITLAHSVVERGWQYLVCSAEDLRRLNLHSWMGPEVLKICPSIAMPDQVVKGDDQRKRITPYEAGELGADYIVVGRAITKAEGDALDIVKQINEDFAKGKATWEKE